jgi:hypothetical protein
MLGLALGRRWQWKLRGPQERRKGDVHDVGLVQGTRAMGLHQ